MNGFHGWVNEVEMGEGQLDSLRPFPPCPPFPPLSPQRKGGVQGGGSEPLSAQKTPCDRGFHILSIFLNWLIYSWHSSHFFPMSGQHLVRRGSIQCHIPPDRNRAPVAEPLGQWGSISVQIQGAGNDTNTPTNPTYRFCGCFSCFFLPRDLLGI